MLLIAMICATRSSSSINVTVTAASAERAEAFAQDGKMGAPFSPRSATVGLAIPIVRSEPPRAKCPRHSNRTYNPSEWVARLDPGLLGRSQLRIGRYWTGVLPAPVVPRTRKAKLPAVTCPSAAEMTRRHHPCKPPAPACRAATS